MSDLTKTHADEKVTPSPAHPPIPLLPAKPRPNPSLQHQTTGHRRGRGWLLGARLGAAADTVEMVFDYTASTGERVLARPGADTAEAGLGRMDKVSYYVRPGGKVTGLLLSFSGFDNGMDILERLVARYGRAEKVQTAEGRPRSAPHLAGEQIQPHRQVQKTAACQWNIGEVSYPDLMGLARRCSVQQQVG
jgi:hypothetical protein